MRKIEIGPNDAGQRLDRLIGKWLPNASWSEVQKWIRKKYIKINGKRCTDAHLFVNDGDVVEVFLSDATWEAMSAVPKGNSAGFDLDILPWIVAETEDYLVLNKPAGILSHPAEAGVPDLTTLVQQYLGIDEGTRFRPSAAGRLDRNTTGLMVFGKNYAYQKALAESVRNHAMERKYLAVVRGKVEHPEGVLEGYLRKDEKMNRSTFHPIDSSTFQAEEACDRESRGEQWDLDVVYAKTKYRVLAYYADEETLRDQKEKEEIRGTFFKKSPLAKMPLERAGSKKEAQKEMARFYTLLELELVTGRSHQIRVGLAHLGHPIVGDPKYGKADLRHQLLHCHQLGFLGHTVQAQSADILAFLRTKRRL